MIRGTGIDSTVKLYLKSNGANGSQKIFDDSQSHRSITVNGNAQISTAQSKFGGSSLYCSGIDSYVSTNINTTPYKYKFIFAFWANIGSETEETHIFDHGAQTNGQPFAQFYFRSTANSCAFSSFNSFPTYNANIRYTTVDFGGKLNFFMLYCDGSDINLYQNGILCSRTVLTSYSPLTVDITSDMIIGDYGTKYIDDYIAIVGDIVSSIDPTKVPTRQRG